MKKSDFPPEDSLPKGMKALAELIDLAKEANLSFRYVNVLRHRLMDAVAIHLEEESNVR